MTPANVLVIEDDDENLKVAWFSSSSGGYMKAKLIYLIILLAKK